MKKKTLINRELSWLSFNERVLQEAQDPTVPLIERIRFLGIFSNNLDEFFKVRVATIKRMIDVQEGSKTVEGENPRVILKKIQKKVIELQNKFEETYNILLKELEKERLFIINEKQLSDIQKAFVRDYFKNYIYHELSPILLHNVEKFPYLKDMSIYLAVKLFNSKVQDKIEYALIEVPSDRLPRFIQLPTENNNKYIILLEDIIRFSLNEIFSMFDYDCYDSWIIKLTRDAELDMDNDISLSLLELIRKGINNRKTGEPVRFVFDKSISKDLLNFIIEKLHLDENNNLIPGGRYHNFKDFMKFPNVLSPKLEYENRKPLLHPNVINYKSFFDAIDSKDILLHPPYHDFNTLITFLKEAALDPDVSEIFITIYRLAKNSKIINALVNAALNGKKVTAIIELQARFDEEANINWAKKLEEVGAKVIFGIQGLKVHAKLICVTKKVNNKEKNYVCIGTGNFHEDNAKVYSDLFLLTSKPSIANEVRKVFDFFEYTYKNYIFQHLILSPIFTRKKLYKLIDNEIINARKGNNAWMIIKVNNLVDKEIINKLYHASKEGVKIKLIVRGICSLIPGIPGLSDNIEAISIVDRFLEHSRIFIFCNNNNNLYYISSADWMTRNLDRRIEITCPIYDKDIQKEVLDIINFQLYDNVKARIINENQDNKYVTNNNDKNNLIRSQEKIYEYYKNKLDIS